MRGVFAADPNAVAIVESALVFEASGELSGEDGRHGFCPGWRQRFDRIILVTAPDDLKIRRFVERSTVAQAEIRRCWPQMPGSAWRHRFRMKENPALRLGDR